MSVSAVHHTPVTPIVPNAAPADKPNDGDADAAAPTKAATGPGVGGNVDVTA